MMALAKATLPAPAMVRAMAPASSVPPRDRVPRLLVIVPGAVVRVRSESTELAASLVRAVAPESRVMTPPATEPPLTMRLEKALVPVRVRLPASDLFRATPLVMALAKLTLPAPETSTVWSAASKVPVKSSEEAALVTSTPPPKPSVTLAEIVAAPVVSIVPLRVKALPPIE